MKKIYFVLFLFVMSISVFAQDTETTKIFGNNIGHVSNRPTFSRGLTVYTDGTLRFRDATAYLYSPESGVISSAGQFQFNTTSADTNAFATTAATDTVLITGVVTNSIFIVSAMKTSGTVDQQDILQWEAIDGALVVHRMASGESGLKYSYLWVR